MNKVIHNCFDVGNDGVVKNGANARPTWQEE